MLTQRLSDNLRNPNLKVFLKRYSHLVWDYGQLSYGRVASRMTFWIDDVECDDSMDMTVLHEIGHFLQVTKYERLLQENYGMKSAGRGASRLALNNEIETIAISLCLAKYFGVEPTSNSGIVSVLSNLTAFYSANDNMQAWAFGKTYVRAAQLDASVLLLEYHKRAEYIENRLRGVLITSGES